MRIGQGAGPARANDRHVDIVRRNEPKALLDHPQDRNRRRRAGDTAGGIYCQAAAVATAAGLLGVIDVATEGYEYWHGEARRAQVPDLYFEKSRVTDVM